MGDAILVQQVTSGGDSSSINYVLDETLPQTMLIDVNIPNAYGYYAYFAAIAAYDSTPSYLVQSVPLLVAAAYLELSRLANEGYLNFYTKGMSFNDSGYAATIKRISSTQVSIDMSHKGSGNPGLLLVMWLNP